MKASSYTRAVVKSNGAAHPLSRTLFREGETGHRGVPVVTEPT